MISLESLQFISSNALIKYTKINGDSKEFSINLEKLALFKMSFTSHVLLEVAKTLNFLDSLEHVHRISEELTRSRGALFGNEYIKINMMRFGLHRLQIKSGSFILTYEISESGDFSYREEVTI